MPSKPCYSRIDVLLPPFSAREVRLPHPGSSVSAIARKHGINDNIVFEWRRLHRLGRLGLPASTSPSSQCSELLPVHVMALSGCWAGQIRWRDEDIELALSRSPFSSCGHQLCRAVVFSLSVELAISRNCSLSVG
jgi:transposase-like protein